MTRNIIFVDDEQDLVFSTVRHLTRERPDLAIEGFTDPLKALRAVRERPPHLLVTDLRMEGMSGLELLVEAREAVPTLPVVVVTAHGGPEVDAALRCRSSVEYLEKPVRFDRLTASIDRLLKPDAGFSGAISLPMLPDLIQIYTLSGHTGSLTIHSGPNAATLWFESGQIVHAICGDRVGELAVYELLHWKSGQFSLDSGTRPPERTITANWQEILLEGCRRLDEALHEKESTMASAVEPVDPLETFAPLRLIEGYIGAAFHDSGRTTVIGGEGSAGTIDVGAAAASDEGLLKDINHMLGELRLNDEIVDLIMTLGKQIHLVRPVQGQQGKFIFVILNKQQANLVMARQALAEAEQAFVDRGTDLSGRIHK